MRELVKNENGMFSSDRINYNNSITDGKVSKNPFISSPLADAGDFSFTFENENGEFIGFLKSEAENKIVIIGNPSYGKTNAFYQIFEITATKKTPVINLIFDSKGDFYKRYRNFKDMKCVVISHSKDYPETIGWNIFNELLCEKDNLEIAAREMAKILLGNKMYTGNRQQFFLDAVIEIFVVAMLIAVEDYRCKGIYPTNKTFVDLVTLKPEILLERAEEYNLKNRIDFIIMPSVSDEYNGQTAGVMAEVRTVVNTLFVGTFKDAGSFSVRNVIRTSNETVNIFIEYDVNFGHALSPIYTCIITQAIKESLGRNVCNCTLNIFIDEWSLLDKIPDMSNAISFGRERGLFVAAALQHVGQIYNIYGDNIAKGMLNGFHNMIVFNTNDKTSRDYIKDRVGNAYIPRIEYPSLSQQVSSYVSESIISDEDILSLKVGEALIFPGTQRKIYKFKFRKVK